jgi:hypothetical protein
VDAGLFPSETLNKMARKRVSACIRCDAEGSLSKVGEHHFCKSCLAESRRHIYGTPPEIPAIPVPEQAKPPVNA